MKEIHKKYPTLVDLNL